MLFTVLGMKLRTKDILPRVLPLSYISSPSHDIYKCNRINSNNKM